MISRLEITKRLKNMIILATIFAMIIYIIGYPRAVIGLGIGAAIGMLNYWLIARAALGAAGESPIATQNRLLNNYLLRIGLIILVLVLTILIDLQVFLGATWGLTLEMQTYFGEALKLLKK